VEALGRIVPELGGDKYKGQVKRYAPPLIKVHFQTAYDQLSTRTKYCWCTYICKDFSNNYRISSLFPVSLSWKKLE